MPTLIYDDFEPYFRAAFDAYVASLEAEPEPVTSEPSATPVAAVAVQGTTNGEWKSGFSTQRPMLIFADNASNRAALTVGRTLQFADGTQRTITSASASFNVIYVGYSGDKLAPIAGSIKVYEAGKPEAPAAVEAAPAPVVNQGQIYLNLGLGQGGEGVLPSKNGVAYTFPTRKDWELAASQGFKSARVGMLWERMTGGGAPGRGAVSTSHADSLLKSLEIGKEVGMTVSALDCHNYAGYSVTSTGADRKTIGSPEVPIEALGDDWKAFVAHLWKNAVARDVITGFDLMNEPKGISWDVWKPALQHAINQVASVAPDRMIHCEGINYSSTINWVKNNPTMHQITHPSGTQWLVAHGHLYLDKGSDGFWTTAEELSDKFGTDEGIKRIQSFYDWCQQYGWKGVIGETMVPGIYPNSVANLDSMLGWCVENGIDVYVFFAAEGAGNNWHNINKRENKPSLDVILKHVKR